MEEADPHITSERVNESVDGCDLAVDVDDTAMCERRHERSDDGECPLKRLRLFVWQEDEKDGERNILDLGVNRVERGKEV